MKINEIINEDGPLPLKAGVLPYYRDENDITFLFMIPSDPAYGGNKPNVAKGTVDPGENFLQAAMREGNEELGLTKSNMMELPWLAWSGKIGPQHNIPMQVYAVEVKSKEAFSTPHWETGSTLWLTAEEYAMRGRNSQKHIVASIARKI